MNKEVLVTQITHSVESTKDFITSNYNSLKEYLVKKNMERENTGSGTKFGASCMKCMFILLNVFYLFTALLMLAAGATGQFAYLFYGLTFEYKLVSISWIISGVVLLIVSIFGIVGACKNSVAWTNIYGVLMLLAFAVQLSAAIVGFTLISKSESIARDTLDKFIRSYSYFEPATITMDFIQKSQQCCGVEGPSDWQRSYLYFVSPYHNSYDYDKVSTSTVAPAIPLPISCCASGSVYQNSKCYMHSQKGCLDKMHEITLQVILTIDSFALAVAVVHIVGILAAFFYAKMIRKTKLSKAAHTWNLKSDKIINGPTFVDYIQVDDKDQQLIIQADDNDQEPIIQVGDNDQEPIIQVNANDQQPIQQVN